MIRAIILFPKIVKVTKKIKNKIQKRTLLNFIGLANFVGKELILPLDFIEWFRGFTDAEGSFYIGGAAKGSRFEFIFSVH